ncbi:ubiquitin carrier protein 7 [Zea mays]|uniref:Ubiquitin carrier protein 7 n=1 Tax=Zea mays TaxID=4577 RepID=A0A1D6K7B9_MAIZE|nr:ubiquitin carrier protein 7 [Zea mays]
MVMLANALFSFELLYTTSGWELFHCVNYSLVACCGSKQRPGAEAGRERRLVDPERTTRHHRGFAATARVVAGVGRSPLLKQR